MPESSAGRNRRRFKFGKWKWLAVAILPAIFHAPIFTGLASTLVVDQRDRPADTLVLLFPRQGGLRAVRAISNPAAFSPAAQCLLIDSPPDNLQRGGVEITLGEKFERLLAKQQIPPNRWSLVQSRKNTLLSAVQTLGEWLRVNPDRHVGMLFDRFYSRELSLCLRRNLDRASLERVAIYPLPAEEFDESNWWKSRRGVNRLAHSLPRLWYLWCNDDHASD